MYFSLVAPLLFGVFGLLLDVGWSHFLQKRAQAAADAAALAAIHAARNQIGLAATPTCSTVGCQSLGACPADGNLRTACLYAAANGFTDGGASGRQALKIAGGVNSSVPGASGITADYWVQVHAQQTHNSWLSSLFFNAPLRPAASATAALWKANVDASLYLLNRAGDCFASTIAGLGVVCGEDLLALGSNGITAPGGIYMASANGSGVGLPAIAAGTALGNLTTTAPFTRVMGNGAIKPLLGLASVNWTASPVNGFPDGDGFTDPMAGRGQPPPPTGLSSHPVLGGVIVGSLNPSQPTVLPPGHYFATAPLLGATGTPITITGNVIFSDGTATPCGGFCNYVFHGGLVTGALSTVTFSPGRYVFAGAKAVSGGPGIGFTIGANGVVKDATPLQGGRITRNTDAGEIFIFTDSKYPGLTLPVELSGLSLPQARAGISAGLNPQVTLHGLNASSASLPSALVPFAPALLWQDQANTTLKYTASGRLNTSCGGICTNLLSVPGSQEMILQASSNGTKAGVNFYGLIYQPRMSWLSVVGLLPGDRIAGPFQIISGALQMTLNTSLDMELLPNPPTALRAALVQ